MDAAALVKLSDGAFDVPEAFCKTRRMSRAAALAHRPDAEPAERLAIIRLISH
jgi:hypothetical protein